MSRPRSKRFEMLNRFEDNGVGATLSYPAYSLWHHLYRHADKDGYVRNVSAKRIVANTPLSRRSITNAITELHGAGLLMVVQEGRENGTPAVYRIRHANVEDKPPKPRRRRPRKQAPEPPPAIAQDAIAV